MNKGKIPEVRVMVCGKRQRYYITNEERRAVLLHVAKALTGAATKVDPEKAHDLMTDVAAAPDDMLSTLLTLVAQHTGKPLPKVTTSATITIQQLGRQWTGGELHKRYPDQIKAKVTAEHDAGRLEKYVYSVIGDVPVADVTRDHAQEVMRRLPPKLNPTTRRAIGHLLVLLLKHSVYPLCLRAETPIPPGFLPRRGKRKALACLHPDEVARLLCSPKVPFMYRLLWGFLIAEGMREGEALALTIGDLDLVRGLVRLDKNKTDDPRAWALDKGTTSALCAYLSRARPNAKPGEFVFLDARGLQHSKFGLAKLLRSHLEAIGLKEERPELFESSEHRKQMRVHDLRGTFVTTALANGKSEAWVSARTGHKSSAMINNYKRVATGFEDVKLGAPLPLDQAIPELGSDRSKWPAAWPVNQETTEKEASPRGFEPLLQP